MTPNTTPPTISDAQSEKEPLTEDINAQKAPKTIYHIDEWLDTGASSPAMFDAMSDPGLAYAHFMFSYFRQPAWMRMVHAPFYKDRALFVDYRGKTWRVTGASRMGDIWLAKDFTRVDGYDLRVDMDLSRMSNWRATP